MCGRLLLVASREAERDLSTYFRGAVCVCGHTGEVPLIMLGVGGERRELLIEKAGGAGR